MPDPISSTESTADAAGKAQASGQVQPVTTGQAQTAQAAPAQAQQPSITAEQILAESLPKRTPEDELNLLRTQYKASSTEVNKIREERKAEQAALADQGIEAVYGKDGKFQGFKPNDKYSKDANISIDEKELLTAKDRELLAEDPEKAIKLVAERVLDRAKKALVRVSPTIEKAVEAMTPERLEAYHGHLKAVKTSLGNDLYPDYEQHKATINGLVSSPNLPKAIKAALADEDSASFMLQMIAAHQMHVVNRLTEGAKARIEAEKQRAEKNRSAAELSPTGTGRAEVDGGSGNQAFLKSVFG